MNRTHEKTQECVSELHYKTAYLHLFGVLEQALRDAEERACAD